MRIHPAPEPDSGEFKLSLDCGASASRMVTGTYNRRGLPHGWDQFIREIAGYIRFYESYEDIFKSLYLSERKAAGRADLICQVILREAVRGMHIGQKMKVWK